MNRINRKLRALRVNGASREIRTRQTKPTASQNKTPNHSWITSGGVSVVVAFLALIVSAAQLIVTAPLISQLIFKPNLEIVGEGSEPDGNLFGMFVLINKGSSPATKIEIGFTVQRDQRLQLLPNVAAKWIEDDQEQPIKVVRLELERLNEGDKVTIIALSGNPLPSDLAAQMAERGMKFPTISFIRSAEGEGTIIRGPVLNFPHSQAK